MHIVYVCMNKPGHHTIMVELYNTTSHRIQQSIVALKLTKLINKGIE